MLTGMSVFIVILCFLIFLAVYKRDQISKLLSLNASAPAGEFQEQLEKTADTVIKRLETHIAHLELLLDEADTKIQMLDEKLRALENTPVPNELPSVASVQPPVNKMPAAIDFRLPPEIPPVQASSPTVAQPVENREPRESMGSDKRRLILTMSAQGYSTTEIAKTTGLGRGEIMLVLQLNKK